MQKILIFTAQPTPGEGLKSLLEERGVQVKVVTDFGIATEWLSGRGYDILIVTEDLPEEQLRSLGAALWGKNSSAMAVVTSYDGELPRSPAHYRMFGYSPIPYRELVTTILELRSDGQADLQPDKFPVLVVEDLDSPRDIICIFIESLGFSEVHGVASASEALSLLERDPS
ncbi:MAG: hypothetical protein KDD60_07645, partial [Bdellovibrionales bacterium]|nr:hypothetical protein [Bdellovibrionales bacterium]